MRHHGCPEDAAAEVYALALDDGGRRDVAAEYLADRGVAYERELDAEAGHYGEDKQGDEALEVAETPYGAVWGVED